MGARRELTAALVERYRSAGRADNGRILDELCAVTGWHRKHAVRVLASDVAISPEARRQRRPTYGAPIRDALVALWEASDRICGKAAKGNDSDVAAFAGAAWPAQARPGRRANR